MEWHHQLDSTHLFCQRIKAGLCQSFILLSYSRHPPHFLCLLFFFWSISSLLLENMTLVLHALSRVCYLLVTSPEPVCNKSWMSSCLSRTVRLLQVAQQCFHPQMCFLEHKKNSSKTRGKTSVTFQVNMLMLDTDKGEIICLSWLEKSNSCITLLFIWWYKPPGREPRMRSVMLRVSDWTPHSHILEKFHRKHQRAGYFSLRFDFTPHLLSTGRSSRCPAVTLNSCLMRGFHLFSLVYRAFDL